MMLAVPRQRKVRLAPSNRLQAQQQVTSEVSRMCAHVHLGSKLLMMVYHLQLTSYTSANAGRQQHAQATAMLMAACSAGKLV